MSLANPLHHAPIPTLLARMTIPMTVGIIAILAFSLVDTFFIGLLGTDALAAVSFTFPVTLLVTSLIMGLGTGLSAVLGHTLGQGKHHEAALLTSDTLLLTLLLIAGLGVVGALTIHPLFTLMGAAPALIELIHDYMLIWYLTVPLLAIPMVGNAATRATGDTRTPSLVMAVSGLVNGMLDPLLIFGWGPVPAYGIKGAAIATSISWLMAMLVSLRILRRRDRLLEWHGHGWQVRWQHWLRVLQIAIPAALTNLLTPLATALLLMILASLGTEVIAAYGAASRVESLLLIVMMALSSVLAPFVSQNLGAGQPARARSALLIAMHFALFWQGGIALLVWLLARPIATLFSDQATVIDAISDYLHLLPFGYGAQALVMLLASALNGMRAPLISLLFGGIRLFVLLLPLAWLGERAFGLHGVYGGMLLANLTAGALAYLFARRHVDALCQRRLAQI